MGTAARPAGDQWRAAAAAGRSGRPIGAAEPRLPGPARGAQGGAGRAGGAERPFPVLVHGGRTEELLENFSARFVYKCAFTQCALCSLRHLRTGPPRRARRARRRCSGRRAGAAGRGRHRSERQSRGDKVAPLRGARRPLPARQARRGPLGRPPRAHSSLRHGRGVRGARARALRAPRPPCLNRRGS